MTVSRKIIIVGLALVVFASAFVLKELKKGGEETASNEVAGPLPRLLDLGSDTCVPCKMMAPILEELRAEYKGRMVVEFVDVRRNREIGIEHGIKLIPTQIFFSAEGLELFRHEGFMSKDDILDKWKELGVDLLSGGARPDEG